MSLALFLCLLLLSFDLVPLTLAGPQSSVYLSPYLSEVVPTCAHTCLEQFIAASFPSSTCPDQQSLGCLCSSNSDSNYTLGEGALLCVASACTDPQAFEFGAAYNVCDGIPNAVPMTLGTLTATMASASTVLVGNSISTSSQANLPSASTACCSSSSIFSTIPASSTFPSTGSDISSPTGLVTATAVPSVATNSPIYFTGFLSDTSASTLVMNTFTTTTSSLPTVTAASATSVPPPVLTKAQIAGVAVAGSATAAVAFGLLLFLFCVKKKAANKRNSGSSFGGDEVVDNLHELPNNIVTIPRAARSDDRQTKEAPMNRPRFLGVPAMKAERIWYGSRQGRNAESTGSTTTPENITHEVSPVSAASYRTTSRLLPDKPNYNVFPSPSQLRLPMRPERPFLGNIENPELRLIPPVPPGKPIVRSWKPIDTSQEAMQPFRTLNQRLSSDPFKDNLNDPREMMYTLERERKRASRAQLPRIITPVSQQGQRTSFHSQSVPFYPPPPQRDILAALPSRNVHQYPSQLKPISEVANLSTNPMRPTVPAFDPRVNIQPQRPKFAPYRSKSGGKRPPTHYSSASGTSFEDDGDDDEDEVPPRPLGLSPVQESPNRTPLSHIRYPAIRTATVRQPVLESPTRKPPVKGQANITSGPAPAAASASLKSPKGEQGRNKELPATPVRPKRSDSLNESHQGLQQAVELEAGVLPLNNSNANITRSAKWQILCSPGLAGLENTVSPKSVRTARPDERALIKDFGSPHIWG